MKIEDAIKQKKFKSNHQKAVINIIYTGSWLQGKASEHIKPFGISTQQFNVLRILKGQSPNAITVKDIGSRMLDPMTNASRLVDKLLAKSLVTRITSPEDRRKVEIKITPMGLSLLADIDKDFTAPEHEYKNLTSQEAQLLSTLLDKLRQE